MAIEETHTRNCFCKEEAFKMAKYLRTNVFKEEVSQMK